HNDGNQVGVAPRTSITDSTGQVRWEEGNLAAVGNSPAQYGARALDASGTPIFDSLGVIGIPKLLGSNSSTTSPDIVGPATNTSISGSSVTFTLARQQVVLSLFMLASRVQGATGSFGYANQKVDGSDGGGIYHHGLIFQVISIPGGGTGAFTNGFQVRRDVLGAGSHTIDMSADVDNGQTMNFFTVLTQCYQVGS